MNRLYVDLDSETSRPQTSVVRLNVEWWQNNRIDLRSIAINSDANLLPYKSRALCSYLSMGDFLSAGQFLPEGVDQAWPFLVGGQFKAEHVIVAQPGTALTDEGIGPSLRAAGTRP
ncbi:hypothetical protein K435DRAFT_860750 [Dendrothele bispora CBS 962.96]|uniref:Uncharacterized protein n=1 Tax=Dendrothele bispora (strain CBS 962.96) TaxID=1314807 RepID=A0A4S8LXN0_DENBC|nr:hypothetical protein K435DRAFT_860750 [Dendrothele bispora CBS 962.96]